MSRESEDMTYYNYVCAEIILRRGYYNYVCAEFCAEVCADAFYKNSETDWEIIKHIVLNNL